MPRVREAKNPQLPKILLCECETSLTITMTNDPLTMRTRTNSRKHDKPGAQPASSFYANASPLSRSRCTNPLYLREREAQTSLVNQIQFTNANKETKHQKFYISKRPNSIRNQSETHPRPLGPHPKITTSPKTRYELNRGLKSHQITSKI